MFDLSLPSTMQFSMPDWLGGVRRVGGYVESAATAVYNGGKAFIDPVAKGPINTAQQAVNFLELGYDKAAGAAGDAASGAAAALGKIVSPISSGLKWATIIIVLGAALYALAVLSPFIPKPKGAA